MCAPDDTATGAGSRRPPWGRGRQLARRSAKYDPRDGRPADRGRDRVRCALRLPGDDRRRLRRAAGGLRARRAGRHAPEADVASIEKPPRPSPQPALTDPAIPSEASDAPAATDAGSRAAADDGDGRGADGARIARTWPRRPARGPAVQQGLRHLPRAWSPGRAARRTTWRGSIGARAPAVDARRRPRVRRLRRRRRPRRPARAGRRRQPAAGPRLPRARAGRPRQRRGSCCAAAAAGRAARACCSAGRSGRTWSASGAPGCTPAISRTGVLAWSEPLATEDGGPTGAVIAVDRGPQGGRLLARFEAGSVESLEWTGDSRLLVAVVRTGTRSRAFSIDRDGHRVLLGAMRGGTITAHPSPAGDRVILVRTVRGGLAQVHAVDPESGQDGVVRGGERRRRRLVVAVREPPAARRPPHVAVRRAGLGHRPPAARTPRQRAHVVLPRAGASVVTAAGAVRIAGAAACLALVAFVVALALPAERSGEPGAAPGPAASSRTSSADPAESFEARGAPDAADVEAAANAAIPEQASSRGAPTQPPRRRAARAHRLRRVVRRAARDRAAPGQRGVRGLRRVERLRPGLVARRPPRPRRGRWAARRGRCRRCGCSGPQRRHRGHRRARSQRQRPPGVLGRPDGRHVHGQPPARPCGPRSTGASSAARRAARRRAASPRWPPTAAWPTRRRATRASAARPEALRSSAWSTATARVLASYPASRAIQDVRFTGDGSRVVVVTSDGRAWPITSFGGADARVLLRDRRGALSIYASPQDADIGVVRTLGNGRHAGRCCRRAQRLVPVVARYRRRDAHGLRPGRADAPAGRRRRPGSIVGRDDGQVRTELPRLGGDPAWCCPTAAAAG